MSITLNFKKEKEKKKEDLGPKNKAFSKLKW